VSGLSLLPQPATTVTANKTNRKLLNLNMGIPRMKNKNRARVNCGEGGKSNQGLLRLCVEKI